MADDVPLRKLASIVAVDMAGYSRRTEADEPAAVRAVSALKAQVSKAALAHGGRVFNSAGDGFMLEFSTVSGALAAADDIAAAGDPPVRVGVHLGEVSVTETGDLLGHGVNVAARLQQMASPGAVLVSGDVKRALRGPLGERLRAQGSLKLGKMDETLPVFVLAPRDGRAPRKGRKGHGAAIAGAAAALAAVAAALVLWPGQGWGPKRHRSTAPAGLHPERVVNTPSIAVVGFQAAGGAQATALAASLSGQVADALSHYEVTVVSPPAGAPPDADFAISGRVVQRDRSLTVTTDLSDPRNHVLVYSFDTARPSGKGDVAEEIAGHVALSLDPTKLSNDLAGKLTAADYTLIARANDAIDRWDMPYVLDLTGKLVARHPEDGDLHAGLALGYIYGAPVQPPSQQRQYLDLGRRALAQAEQLSPNSGMVYVAKAALLNGPMAYADQERLLRKALSLTPGFHVTYNSLGELLMMVGRMDEGAALFQRAVQIDPMSNVVANDAVTGLVKAGHAEEAQKLFDHEEQVWPDDWKTIGSEFMVAFYQGTPQQVLAFQRRHVPPKGSTAAVIMDHLGLDAWMTRDPAAIHGMVGSCFAEAQRPRGQPMGDPTPQLAMPNCLIQMVRVGAMDDAFRFARLAYPDHRRLYPPGADEWITQPWQWPDTSWLFIPPMKPFRDDARFWDVAARSGLVDYWQSTGSWPDFCMPEAGRCKALGAAALRADPAKP